MPPKKQQEALKKKIVEDKTFGLKNKNKSKKVQQYVHQVEQQAQQKVEGANRRRNPAAGGSASSEHKPTKKALLAARLEELSLLSQPVVEKKKKADEEAAERKRQREAEEAERLRIASLPVEDQIEEERAKLLTRTPVTVDLFLAWKKRKDEERVKREEAALTAAQKNKSRADRLRGAGLTGRQLFEQYKDIFVDDDEADNTKYERPENDWIGDEDDDENGNNNEQRQGEVEDDAHNGNSGAKDLGQLGKMVSPEDTTPRDLKNAQNSPEQEYEPPSSTKDEEPEASVGDESLFS